jgi:hypothetical protein
VKRTCGKPDGWRKETMSMYSVVNETTALKQMKLRMNALYMVEPATGPPKWLPPSNEECLAAIGDTSQLTRQFKEVLNGNSDNFSKCPAPWDDDYLAKHGTEENETGQTFDEWNALLVEDNGERKDVSPTKSKKGSSSPYKVKRSTVKELRKEYQALHAKNKPTPQQLWKREQIANAKQERKEAKMLEKNGIGKVLNWSCQVCFEKNISSHTYSCPECGSAPQQPLQSKEEKSDEAIMHARSLATLSKC